MSQEIVIVREPDGYRVLHGHLHLATEIMLHNEVVVDVRDEGKVKIIQTGQGYFAGRDGQRLPILRS
jgi:hypothetical protein